jgi:hypothetical protein
MKGKPSQEYLVGQLRLHMQGDPVAQSRLAEVIYPHLVEVLGFKYRNVDDEWIHEAASEAVIRFLKHPDSYDSTQKSLLSYLEKAASGDSTIFSGKTGFTGSGLSLQNPRKWLPSIRVSNYWMVFPY